MATIPLPPPDNPEREENELSDPNPDSEAVSSEKKGLTEGGEETESDLDEDDVKRIVFQAVQQSVRKEMSVFSGPLPPPELLGEYEKVSPGCARFIMETAKREQAHRQKMDQLLLKTEIRELARNGRLSERGQICALVISLAVVFSGVAIAWLVPSGWGTVPGGVVSTSGLVSLVKVFLAQSKLKEEEKERAGQKEKGSSSNHHE